MIWLTTKQEHVNIWNIRQKIIERTSNNSRFNSEVAVPLKSLSNLGDLLICHWLTLK